MGLGPLSRVHIARSPHSAAASSRRLTPCSCHSNAARATWTVHGRWARAPPRAAQPPRQRHPGGYRPPAAGSPAEGRPQRLPAARFSQVRPALYLPGLGEAVASALLFASVGPCQAAELESCTARLALQALHRQGAGRLGPSAPPPRSALTPRSTSASSATGSRRRRRGWRTSGASNGCSPPAAQGPGPHRGLSPCLPRGRPLCRAQVSARQHMACPTNSVQNGTLAPQLHAVTLQTPDNVFC